MVIDISIDTTIENIDVATYFKLKDIKDKKKNIATICHNSNQKLIENDEYIKLQFEEMNLLKEDYELF